MAAYIDPFDFRKILVEYFLGSTELFTFAMVIIISIVCAKFQIPARVFMIILALSALIFSYILGQAIYILIILIVGYIAFKSLAKLLN